MSNQELADRLAAIEARLAELEKHSHPPVDLRRDAYRAMAQILTDAARLAEDSA